jgi:hypothetical protein
MPEGHANLLGLDAARRPARPALCRRSRLCKWINANYADIGVLNAQWNTSFESLQDVTLANSAQVVLAWQQRKTTPVQVKSPIDAAIEEAQQAAKTGNTGKSKQPAKPSQETLLRENRRNLRRCKRPICTGPFIRRNWLWPISSGTLIDCWCADGRKP